MQFFLLPLWFGSAEWRSVSVVFPILLAGLALFSCFDDHFTRFVIQHRVWRTFSSAVLAFSVSVPAVSLLTHLPLRLGVAMCAAAAEVFSVKTPKVFVHFAVVAPERYRQAISFQWYADGEKVGRPIPSSVVGGRKRGFRTWTYLKSPHKGEYRVDLSTTLDGQLIGRTGFRVK